MTISFGKVSLQGRWWVIAAEPHVRMRLKRVFPRAPQHASELIRISATHENTRELEWFLQRYAMEVDRPDVMARLAREHREGEDRLGKLLGGYVPLPPSELAVPAREYQLFAAQMLALVKGLLLADDLGTGKTASAICPMVYPANLPAAVVCPAYLTGQWQSELAFFAPHLRTHILRTTQPYDLAAPPGSRRSRKPAEAPSIPDVIITSYHKLRGWSEVLAPILKYIVFDEGQALRHSGTGIYQASAHVAAHAHLRLALSATPIHGYGSEFFYLLNVLRPGALGEYSEFVRDWCVAMPGEKARLSDPKAFGAYLRREGLMLRRTRRDVGRELPPLTKIVHTVEADQAALHDLGSAAVELAKIIVGHNEQYRGQRLHAAGEFDSLVRQATGISKAKYVAEFVKMILETGEAVILYGWHRAVYAIWMEALAPYQPVLYTGSETPSQKQKAIDSFTSGKTQLFIASLRGVAGLDGLQGHCRTAVFGELDWSGAVHQQCMARFHRDGQDEPCTAYFMAANSGSDPIMMEVLGIKREQLEGVCNPDSEIVERVNTGENAIRRIAREFLLKQGIALPASNVIELPAGPSR